MRRREVVCGSNDKTQNVVLDCDHLTDTTTPTRRLEFGNESSTLDGSHPLARRVWERDITAFLASRSYVSFTRDPLLELKLDETQVVLGERGEGEEEEAVAPSRKLSVSHSTSVPLHARQEATQTEDKDKAEERQQQPQVGCSLESKPLLLSPSRYTAEEEEEQVIIGRDLVYPTADTFSIHGLKKNVPVVDRGSSTPCLIPTPDTHAHKRGQVVSQSTATECMPSLVMQEFSPGQHANVFPFRLWNSHSQEETGATFPETINNDVGMKGTRPPSLPPQQQRQQEDSAESLLYCSPRKNAMRRRVVGVKKRKNSAFVKSLVPSTSKNCGVEEEDAPLLHPARSVKQPIKKETDSMADASRPPHYTVGMRVEGRWGCRWFAAVVTEEEKNGYVQICWDEDGSFLHMKVREVRLPHDEGRKTENRLNASPPTMTATQLVELMDSDTPCHPLPMKNTLRLSPLNESDYVSLSLIYVYLTPASRLYLAEKWSMLKKMVENGMTIVESPLDLESDSLTSSSDCHAGADECMSFFVVTEEDAKENEGRMITIAHAMGLSAVSVSWLEEIKDDELEERFQRLRVPRPKDLVGQGSDTCLRCKALDSKSERFLSHKTIYLTGEDTDIVFLLQVCGGTVTYRLPSNGVSSPHYVYVAPGKRAKVIPSIASVTLLEKSWLIQRIHELFMALPQSRYNRRNNDNTTTTNNNNNNDTVNQVLAGCPLSGTKHPREEMDGKRNMTETMPPSPMAVAEQEESRVQLQKDVANGVPEVFVGEDYYFRMPPVGGKDKNNRRKENETHVVELGRVVSLRGGDGVVTLQLYSVKHTLLRQNPRTGSLENHTTVYLGTRTATVSVEDLLFNIPVYVVDASQMQHVYTLESPPRGMDSVTVGGGVSQRMDTRVAAEEESMYRRRMEEKESPAFCPEGLSYSSSSSGGDAPLRYGNQDNAVLKEILVNGWQIRSGVDVRFHDYLSSTRSVKCSSDGESTGRVQMIQRVASGVVLVVHKVDASDDSSESKMVVITPDMVTDPLLELDSVSFEYPRSGNSGVHNVTFRVNGGDRVLVIGPNGCGKSTLLSLVAGQRRPSFGSVTALGLDAFDNTRLQRQSSLIAQPWPAEAFFSVSVDKMTSPAPLPERRRRIAEALHIDLGRNVGDMSSGERRRVQILYGLMQESQIYLLDECSTDIDVAERRTVLELVKSECFLNKSCCLYATHILDGVSDWATHILLMQKGTIADFKKVSDIEEPLETFVRKFLTRHHAPMSLDHMKGMTTFDKKDQPADDNNGNKNSMENFPHERKPVIVCDRLEYKNIFRDLSFTVYKGERVLLCGCNGAGKSTLLNMMGGKQFLNNKNRSLSILGKFCYDDMTLNSLVAFGGDWWTSAPPGEMHVNEMIEITTARGRRLCELLEVDLSWDIRYISTGEQKRVQLLLHLLEDRPVVLLDEATSDLDLDQRYELLSFLYSESVNRGVTVVYATHIFGGLENWPTAVMILDSAKRGMHAMWRGNDLNMGKVVKELMYLKNTENYIE